MLPMENGTKTIHTADDSEAVENGDENSSKPNERIGVEVRDGGNCSNGIRVKVVAEINENCSSLDVVAELNGTQQGTRKRLASTEAASSSKRSKPTECEADELPVSTSTESAEPDDGGHVAEVSTATDDLDNHNEARENVCDDAALSNDAECAQSSSTTPAQIKTEPPAEPDGDDGDDEVRPSGSGTSNPVNIKPAVKVEKADATSSTSRESCKFGIRCYRRNPMHRTEEAHPGDRDYKRPNFPAPPDGTPDCPYGDKCYRRNPTHFQQYNHPADTDFEQNYKNYRMRLRQRPPRQTSDDRNNASGNSSDLDDEYDLEDPFLDDTELDSDYKPSDNEEDEEDYDECDKAEE